MKLENSHSPSARWLLWSVPVVVLLGLACQSENRVGTDGETHFLKSCSPTPSACGDGLSCLCGVCTLECNAASTCSGLPGAHCVSASAVTCGDSLVADRCDVECVEKEDCVGISPFHVCSNGLCRTEAPPGPPTSMPDAAGDAASPAACPIGKAAANQVLVMGDSFFGNTHQITAYLEELARAEGFLASGERYRDNSRVTANTLSGGASGIAGQYAAAIADAKVSVVVMDGGGADALGATCDPFDSSCPDLVNAVDQAAELLAQMATDGVEQVVYAFYPDPTDTALRQKLDALRTPMEAACSAAPLKCDWLDLRAVFSGHDDYLAADGALPSASGSEASAAAIWELLQEPCALP